MYYLHTGSKRQILARQQRSHRLPVPSLSSKQNMPLLPLLKITDFLSLSDSRTSPASSANTRAMLFKNQNHPPLDPNVEIDLTTAYPAPPSAEVKYLTPSNTLRTVQNFLIVAKKSKMARGLSQRLRTWRKEY